MYDFLSEQQIQTFLTEGALTIRQALSPKFVAEHVRRTWARLGMDEQDRDTWHLRYLNLPTMNDFEFETHAPRAGAAVCDLLGGLDRINPPFTFHDNHIINLIDPDQTWQPPGPDCPGWHKDGDWFRHYLDSPEQAILCIIFWSDIKPGGGGTIYSPDSVKHIVEFLRDHPEGVDPALLHRTKQMDDIIHQCSDFREATGDAGDVTFLHPFTLHTSSVNSRPEARIISNACVSLIEPMNFKRENPADHSAIEQAVLNAVDVDRFDFRIAGPRQRITPQRHEQWNPIRREHDRNLQGAGLPIKV